jgi:hypothetical protein
MLTLGAICKIRVLVLRSTTRLVLKTEPNSTDDGSNLNLVDNSTTNIYLCINVKLRTGSLTSQRNSVLFSMQICPIIARIWNCQFRHLSSCPANIVSSLQLNLLVRHLGSQLASVRLTYLGKPCASLMFYRYLS